MQIVNTYTLNPGQCHLCAGNRTPVIDTLRDIDRHGWEGRLYICFECAGGMAQLIGWAPPDKHEDMVELAASLKKKNTALEKKVASLKKFEEAVKELA